MFDYIDIAEYDAIRIFDEEYEQWMEMIEAEEREQVNVVLRELAEERLLG